MKKAETVLNFNKDSVTMFGEQSLLKTSSVNYAIPITKSRKLYNSEVKQDVSEEYCLLTVDVKTRKEKENMVSKLHRQIKQLMKASSLWKDDTGVINIVDEVSKKCDICKMYMYMYKKNSQKENSYEQDDDTDYKEQELPIEENLPDSEASN